MLSSQAGTEWATDMHKVSEPFALVERDTLTAVELISLGGATVVRQHAQPERHDQRKSACDGSPGRAPIGRGSRLLDQILVVTGRRASMAV